MYSYFYIIVCGYESYEGLVDIGKEHASYKIGVSQMSSMLR